MSYALTFLAGAVCGVVVLILYSVCAIAAEEV